jgi:methylmalonyl-CoA mutase
VQEAVDILKAALRPDHPRNSGIGQSDTEILDHSDVSLYIMTPEFGAATQLEKIDMLDFADVVAHQQVRQAGAPRCHPRCEEAVQAQPPAVGRQGR